MFNDKKLKSVADAVMKVEGWMKKEELKGDQHKLDVNKNKKVDAQDLAILRSKKNEEVESVEEGFEKDARVGDTRKTQHGVETKTATGLVHRKTYKDEPETDDDEAPKTKKKGVFKRRYNTKMYKEQFSGLLDSYANGGLKGIMEDLEVVEVEEVISEESTNDEFKKEIDDAQDKSEGKKKADVAAASVQAVKNEEVEQIDELSKNTLNSYVKKSFSDKEKDNYNTPQRRKGLRRATSRLYKEEEEQIDERHLTEPEMKKREEVVKSMKKNIAGFKERYGKRGKEVLYATATRIAKGEK